MADRRYSTAAWQRLRRQVLARDQYICRIQGPRCRGTADTVHHIIPISQGGAFWDEANLAGACSACNYGDGAHVKAENERLSRERIAYLEDLVQEQQHRIDVQQERIDELAEALARERNSPATRPARNGRKPAIR
jgi:5-methylcytosine-specific restriction endonuclease McrA